MSTGGDGSGGGAPPDRGCGIASDSASFCVTEGLEGNARLAPNLTITCEPWKGAGGWVVSGSCYARYSLLRGGTDAAVGGGGGGAADAAASTASARRKVPSAHGLTAWALGAGLLFAFVFSIVYIGATAVAAIHRRFGCGGREGDDSDCGSDSDGDCDGDGDAADRFNGRRWLRRAEGSDGVGALNEDIPLLATPSAAAERVRVAGGTPAVVPAAVIVPAVAARGVSAAGARGGSPVLHDGASGPRWQGGVGSYPLGEGYDSRFEWGRAGGFLMFVRPVVWQCRVRSGRCGGQSGPRAAAGSAKPITESFSRLWGRWRRRARRRTGGRAPAGPRVWRVGDSLGQGDTQCAAAGSARQRRRSRAPPDSLVARDTRQRERKLCRPLNSASPQPTSCVNDKHKSTL